LGAESAQDYFLTFLLDSFFSSFLGAAAAGAVASASSLAFLASFFFWAFESCSVGFSSSISSALRFFSTGFSAFSTFFSAFFSFLGASSMGVILLRMLAS